MDDQLKIIISTEIDTSKSEQQINSQLKQVKTEPVKIAVEFDTVHMKELKKQLADIAKEQEKLQGFTNSKVSIKTTNTGEIDTASIKYYNDLTKETVTQLYIIDKETGKLALSTKNLTTDYQAQVKSEQLTNKQRLDFINNQIVSLDKLKASYADNNALKSLDGDNLTQLNSVYDGIIVKTDELKTADKVRSEEIQREIKTEIASYEQLIKSKQNSQYVATSLRTKDTSTINSEEVNNLRKFEAQIKNSSVDTKAMESDVKDLHTALSTAFDKDSLTSYLNQLSIAKSKFSALKEEAKVKIMGTDNAELQEQTKYYDKIQQELITIQKLKKQLVNAGLKETTELNRQITNAQKNISYDEQQIEKKKLYNQELFKEVNELKLIQEAENKIASAKQNDKVNDSYIKKQIQEEQQLQNQKDQFNAKNLNAIDLEIQKQEQASKSFSNQLKSQMQGNVDSSKQSDSFEQIGIKANIGKNRLQAFSKELKSTAQEKYATTINSIANSFDNVSKSADPSKALKQANASLQEFQSNMKATGEVGNTFLTKLGKNLYNFFGFLGSATIAMSAINGIRSMVSSITDLDTQMVELRKVTNETESTYQKFYSQANETAKSLGTSTANVISATASWAQMGYSIQQATELAKSSEILSNISENMNVDEATSTLVSSIKAFGLDANKVLDGVVSKINEVGNQFAVTNSDVADILQRSSSAMSDANNTMEETIALGTAATEITRNAEETGTALKTLSMRIRGMNEDTGETDDSLKNLSKTVKGLTGVSIFTDETNQTYKSTYQILQQISKVYGNLSDKSQAQVLELIAGKRQGQVVSSMLSNFSTAEKALEVQANSAGGAMREQATYMDSINAHVNTLKETFVGLGQSLVKSDLVKFIVDLGTTGVSGLKGLVDTLGTLPTLIGAISMAFSVLGKNAGVLTLFGNQNGSFSFLGKTIEEMKQAKDEGQKFGGLFTKQVLQPFANAESVINKYNLGLQNNSLTQKGYQRLLDQSDLSLNNYLRGLNGAPAKMEDYNKSLKSAKISTVGLTIATTAMNMIMTVAVAAGIGLLITGISNYINKVQILNDKLAEKATTSKEEIKSLDTLIAKYKELASADTQDVSTREQLKSLQEEITDLVGTQANNLDLVNGKLDEQLGKLKNISLENLKEKLPDLEKDMIAKQQANKVQGGATGAGDLVYETITRTAENVNYQSDLQKAGYSEKSAENMVNDSGVGSNEEQIVKLKAIADVIHKLGSEGDADWLKITDRIDKYQKVVNSAKTATDDYNKTLGQTIALEKFGNDLSATKDDVLSFATALKTSSEYTQDQKQAIVDNLITLFPQYTKSLQDTKIYLTDMTTAEIAYYSQQKTSTDVIKENTNAQNDNSKVLSDRIKMLSDLSDKTSILAQAEKDIADNGTISASTQEKIYSLGQDYVNLLYNQNGQLKINSQGFKDLAFAESNKKIADLELQKSILTTKLKDEQLAVDSLADSYDSLTDAGRAYYDRIVSERNKRQSDINSIDDEIAGIKIGQQGDPEKDTGKKSDPNQDAYEKAMANHIHLHNMQLESDADFYNAMEQANETYYKNDVDHLKDYNTNIETIYNGRNDIIKQAFEDEKEIASNGNSGSIADQKKYLETLSKLNDEYYKGKTQFGKEYIATQKEIAKGQADLIKQENESQIDFVSSQKDKFDKIADDKISALKAQNEEVDKQLEKQQHLLDLEEKEIALKKAQENTRMVVGANGIEYRTNPDDIKNAEQDVAKAKQAIEQDKVDEQVTALEGVKKTGDAIYDVLLEMYKALTGKDVTPTKSNPEVEARLKQATTIDKDGTTLVSGTPITPLINTKTPFDGMSSIANFNQGNFNMSNVLGDSFGKLGELGAVTNDNSMRTQSVLYNFDGANFNLPNAHDGRSFTEDLINFLPNATAQINGKK